MNLLCCVPSWKEFSWFVLFPPSVDSKNLDVQTTTWWLSFSHQISAEVDRMHKVTSPVFGPFHPTTSQIGRLLGQIHVPQSMTDIIIFVQSFSIKKTDVWKFHLAIFLPRNTTFKKSSFSPAFPGKVTEFCLQTILPDKAGIHSVPRPGRQVDKIHPPGLFPNFYCWNNGIFRFYLNIFPTFSFIFGQIIPNFGILKIEEILKVNSIILSWQDWYK